VGHPSNSSQGLITVALAVEVVQDSITLASEMLKTFLNKLSEAKTHLQPFLKTMMTFLMAALEEWE